MRTRKHTVGKSARLIIAAALGAVGLVAVESAIGSTPVHASVAAGQSLRVNVPDAVGGKTVFGQLTVDQVTQNGFVTAYGCDDGIPRNTTGDIAKSDLNYDGTVTPVASNRLIVNADNDGDICFYTLRRAQMIIDINGVTDTGLTPITNQRTDTRSVVATPASTAGLQAMLLTAADVPPQLEPYTSFSSLLFENDEDGACTGTAAVEIPVVANAAGAGFRADDFSSFVVSEAAIVANGGAADMMDYQRAEAARCQGVDGIAYTLTEIADLGADAITITLGEFAEIWFVRAGDDLVLALTVPVGTDLDGRSLLGIMLSRV